MDVIFAIFVAIAVIGVTAVLFGGWILVAVMRGVGRAINLMVCGGGAYERPPPPSARAIRRMTATITQPPNPSAAMMTTPMKMRMATTMSMALP